MENSEKSANYLKNVLTLAFLGDSVFSLMVKNYLVTHKNSKPKELNKMANSVVCAKAQAEFMLALKDKLLEDELDIVMRARNTHLNSIAKHSTLEEYSLATQFEALVGYWYLNNEQIKLENMFNELVVGKL